MFTIFLTLSVIFSFVSCEWGKKKNSEESENTSQVEAEAEENVSVNVEESTNTNLSFQVKIPKAKLVKFDGGKLGDFIRFGGGITLEGGGIDNFSKPEVPIYLTDIAVPVGEDGNAKIVVKMEGAVTHTGVKIYPIQKPERASADSSDNNPFQLNEKIYLNSAVKSGMASFVPKKDQDSDEANIYTLKVNLVDYDPVKQTLTTYSSFTVKTNFEGDSSQFSVKRISSNSEIGSLDKVDEYLENNLTVKTANVLNSSVVTAYQKTLTIAPVLLGYRFIIITDPDFAAAANNLRLHKISRGISTVVYTTTTTGTTAAQIKTFLQNKYSTWFARPKWVLFIGDAEFIPTHSSGTNTWDGVPNAGDIYYGQFGADDTAIPVFGIGRLPVDTNDQAQTIVDKIIEYENNPPTFSLVHDNPFYYTLNFASEFQDNGSGKDQRQFAQTSEHIRNYIVSQGISVNRIYNTNFAASDPRWWSDGTAVPAYLRKPGFAWDGDKNDIINAVNEGTSILYHRDHGWWYGWGVPSFHTDDLAGISVSNNEFPVVYSINCASGIFDNETVVGYGITDDYISFSEAFIRKADGAIAVIGDTRSSSTTLNNDMAKGLFDATWNNYLPYGPAASIRKLGDILNHAKGYVKSLGYDVSSTRQELKIYNLLGDPTVEVKSRKRFEISIGKINWEKYVEIPIYIPEPSPCTSCPPIMIVALYETANGSQVLGREILKSEEMKETNTIQLQLSNNDVKSVKIVISGTDIKTEVLTLTR